VSTGGGTFQDRTSKGDDALERVDAVFLVLEGERLSAGGARSALTRVDEVVLGRGAERCMTRRVERGVRILDVRVPDRRMSATHARLTRTSDRWIAEDAGSTNGSKLNGAPLTRAVLTDGDLLEVGWTTFLFRERVADPATAPDVDRGASSDRPDGLATLVPGLALALQDVERVGRSGLPVVLLGETGTGKEVLARALHVLSARPGEFVAVNCAALPAALVESQLFGHVRGAFSGAVRDAEGLVRAAHRGTLFLDEIGDLPPASQPAFLRVLQEQEVVPVGSTRPAPVDLRIVAATNHLLDAQVARGEFRADLFARLSGFVHRLLPLRERREDLGLLIAQLLQTTGRPGDLSMSPDAARAILRYSWPLNIRELAQALSRAAVLARGGVIDCGSLPEAIGKEGRAPADATARVDSKAQEEASLRAALVAELAKHGGNVTEVARALGKARTQVHRWMKRFDLDASAHRK